MRSYPCSEYITPLLWRRVKAGVPTHCGFNQIHQVKRDSIAKSILTPTTLDKGNDLVYGFFITAALNALDEVIALPATSPMGFCGFFLYGYCRVTHLKSAIAFIPIWVFPWWHIVISRARSPDQFTHVLLLYAPTSVYYS
jgi:hypothetical protein